MELHPSFLTTPLAHRGLHGLTEGCVENSPSAFDAAIAGGYGIELDVQLSSDGMAIVFHDDDLDRLTDQSGPVLAHTAEALTSIVLKGSTDRIPTLRDVLAQIRGRVPLLVEIKDQDGALGPNTGILENDVAASLQAYDGPVAVMSFNPHAMIRFHQAAPGIPCGLVTCDFSPEDWPGVPGARLRELSRIDDLDKINACFISHDRTNLESAEVARVKAAGLSILCWTVRSPEQEHAARKDADNITFEGYLA